MAGCRDGMEPVVEDYGDGYMAFCPVCGECLGWESERVETCPACGAEMEYTGDEHDKS